jgi:hypothetical protein
MYYDLRRFSTRKFVTLLTAVVAASWLDGGVCQGAGEGKQHWAFQPVTRPTVPTVKDTKWPLNPIDNFVLVRLDQQGISPAPEADPATKLRRLTLDMTGLPATPDEVAQFLADPSREAYDRVVERLLASPHHGERMARHWLDIARYADSAGYEFDTKRDVWKYRDWVIQALNNDLPYDEFLVEQLAGDLITPTTEDHLVATGFNCNALKQAPDQPDTTVDRLSAFGTAYLGLTVGCARCHDHKFDPISRHEFSQLYAFFNQSDDKLYDFAPPEKVAEREAVKQQVSQLKRELATYQSGPDQDPFVWAARLTNDDLMTLSGELRMAIGMLSKDRTDDQKQKILEAHAQALARFRTDLMAQVDAWSHQLKEEERKGLDAAAQAYVATPADKRAEDLPSSLLNEFWKHDPSYLKRTAVIAQLEQQIPATITTLVFRLRSDNPKTYENLDPTSGKEVEPGVPAFLPALQSSGRVPTRLDLAHWAVSRKNPLTARVVVNRIWQYYFGIGIVDTTDNLGTQASPPSHQELLDWLAAELMDNGWRLKHIEHLITTSATYLQSSRSRPELKDIDPQNRLLARQNRVRLDAEIIRDTALASSGLINLSIGGPSVYPYQPEDVMQARADSTKWVMSQGADRYRRGMYVQLWRLTPHPYFRLFDAPDATESCPRRPRSNTPLQALTLLNDPWFMESAVAMAARILKEQANQTDDERLDWVFRVCLGRSPSLEERRILNELLTHQQQQFEREPDRAATIVGEGIDRDQAVRQAAWTAVSRAVLNLDEFVTRE